MENNHNLPRIGISIGDFNGISPEVILKTLLDNRIMQMCIPVVYGSGKLMSFHRKTLNLGELNFNLIKSPEQGGAKQPNLINLWDEELKIELGTSTEIAGQKAFESLEKAVADLKEGKIDALVTAPINKKNIQSDTFKFAGHTEYLAEQFGVKNYLMFLVSEKLRVGTVTGHIPVSKVAQELSVEKIVRKVKVMHQSLMQDFGIRKPKIAVLGLNPHNGDNGLMGNEEAQIILPAINQLKDEGILAFGPYAADGFFASPNYLNFDGIMAMYHDQGLVPFKALSFETGVNYTAGLPVVRTSPDHGVGYDIAGKGIASEQSFRDALYMALDIIRKRAEYSKISANPLPFSKPHRGERERNTIE